MDDNVITEQQPAEILPEPVKKKSKLLWIAAAVACLALLGAAAFLGARLLNPQQSEATESGGPRVSIMKGGGPGGGTKSETSIKIEPAKELPQRRAEASGIISEIKDRSIFVRTGTKFSMMMNKNGEASSNIEDEGPTIEVVVTDDTQVYSDITFEDGMPEEEETIAQVVEPVAFSDLKDQAMVSVWGSKRGDRLIAEVILYSPPLVSEKR